MVSVSLSNDYNGDNGDGDDDVTFHTASYKFTKKHSFNLTIQLQILFSLHIHIIVICQLL